jgi:protocatechuate 3,4-dioxygenase beta subunit
MKSIVRGLFILSLACWPGAASPPSVQGQMATIGILPFLDDSGTHAPPEFLRRIDQEFKLKMTLDYKDVLGRLISGDIPGGPAAATIGELAALGGQQGVQFVMRGGLLAVVSEKSGADLRCRLELFCDLVAADSRAVSSYRAEGTAVEAGSPPDDALRWESYDWNDAAIGRSALAQALSAALASLVEQVHEAAVAVPAQAAVEAAQDETASSTAGLPVDPYQSDQDLQQLIAQAESLISGGAASSLGDLSPLQQSLEGLTASMDTKLGLLEQAQDTSAVDQQILQQKEELRSLVDSYTQQLADASAQPDYAPDMTGGESELTAKLKELLEKAMSSLLDIQEVESALEPQGEGEQEDLPPADELNADEFAPTEEESSNISGVVIDEAGDPIVGATVLDPETGASDITGSTGSYTLTGLPGGRMANLQVVSGGQPIAAGRVDIQAGRTGIADWVIPTGGGASTSSASLILPSMRIVPISGKRSTSGTIRGVVLSNEGLPIGRALVTAKGVGCVRADSAGRYSFANVPPGSYELVIQRPGGGAQTQRVKVAGGQTAELRTLCRAQSVPAVGTLRDQVFVKDGDTVIRGRVVDDKGKPLVRAKVTVIYRGGTHSVYSDGRGGYTISRLKQGAYRILASKAGYRDSFATVDLKKNRRASQNYKLKPASSPTVLQAVASQGQKRPGSTTTGKTSTTRKTTIEPLKPATGTTTSRTAASGAKATTTGAKTTGTLSRSQAATVIAKGGVQGKVVDGKTGKPVKGATVVLKGKPNVQTDSLGRFSFGDLAPGTYTASVKKSGYANGSGSFKIKSGGTVTVRVLLKPLAAIKTGPATIRKF